ncbi:uncharacterized protein KY384_002476 [Bacidia gigantensis]|uniref:uncharacterized protein n=1 Tax=Bacidia gigantensis TaxID=2732470 RepID=UPI001D048FB1|nr:uncharacterized protein KY384_002476 [Bacidia gigantensis]KAG8532599.1 hypothetical protein KY384_002476 [Bacidia gigantensis]
MDSVNPTLVSAVSQVTNQLVEQMTSTSSTSATAVPTSALSVIDSGAGEGQSKGSSLNTFLSTLSTGAVIFGLEILLFIIINNKLERIYLPKTFLVPGKERTAAPSKGFLQWIPAVFKTTNSEFIQKCGLDAYFFLRYLRTLLKIFIPCALILLPILFPVNIVGGRGPHFADLGEFSKTKSNGSTDWNNVNGLDILAWGNVHPFKNNRYWTHLMLALGVIIYSCWVFFDELRGYIRLRQAYLTSPQHRLRASATTVLITAIPTKWCTFEALDGLYDVYPGGIRNIWINRNFDDLSDKIKQRNKLAKSLESAETKLVKNAKEAAVKQAKKDAKRNKPQGTSGAQSSVGINGVNQSSLNMAQTDGISAGNPHQLGQTLDEILDDPSPGRSRPESPVHKKPIIPIAVVGQGIEAVSEGLDRLGRVVFNKKSVPKQKQPNDVGEDEKPKKKKEIEAEKPKITYRTAHNEDYDPNEGQPKWKEYLKEGDRDTMRLPIFGWQWMISLPLLGQKVDTIYHCRKELARLNLEIEEDQKDPEKYPLMNSAFVQFNHQVAAHMACQCASHHIPKQMAPRVVEISPGDVIWENMSLKWWETYIRTGIILVLIAGLVVTWAAPVTFTGLVSNLTYLQSLKGLHWVGRIPAVAKAIIQGVLPPALLALILLILPLLLRFLAKTQGCLTGMSVELTVQIYYFTFLFVQVFLVVSISSGITTIIPELAKSPQSTPSLLASNLPKASNYFFSYMLLQAFGTSGGALVQLGELFKWYILAPIMDSTARQKFRRQINLPNVHWGKFFPVYTNLACIGLIYSVISPLILIFNIITFSLFWFVYRYNTLYVTKFGFDTGGLLYPTAINQLFTGLYTMELCLIGLFFLVRDAKLENGVATTSGSPCKVQGIIMIVAFFLTIIFQYLLNTAFGPLLRYLPITLEDEAVMRDEEFSHAQEKRWAVEEHEQEERKSSPGRTPDAEDSRPSYSQPGSHRGQESIEMENFDAGPDLRSDLRKLLPPNPLLNPKSWADRGNRSRTSSHISPGFVEHLKAPLKSPRRRHHTKSSDIEAQHKGSNHIGEALFAGINDEIEDLTPDDRDKLVRRAFQHSALRARRPVIWIPRDDLGISDDEVKRTNATSEYIWISNEGTGLDAKGRVIYRRSPPDFSEIDLIEL